MSENLCLVIILGWWLVQLAFDWSDHGNNA